MSKQDILMFRGDYSFLSNFSPYGFSNTYGTYWPTVEHFYQAHKSRKRAIRKLINQASSPSEAKRLGNSVELRYDWKEVKVKVMRTALGRKFTQNPYLKSRLLLTGDAHLEEGNYWGDTYWGVCKGVGENMLGKLLMELRDKLKE